MIPENYPNSSLTREIIGAAQAVHNELGSGFLESVYQAALGKELEQRGIKVMHQAPLEVRYRGEPVGSYFADMLVDGRVICELKAVKSLTQDHESQLIHYLKATKVRIGLLLNFGSPRLEVRRRIYTEHQRTSAENLRNLR